MTLRILVVDDEPMARERLKRLIQAIQDYELAGEAENGEQALIQMANLEPDIVLMDIRMPGMDGMEAAEQIARMEKSPALIFCTAYDEYAINAFKVNAADYLLKPVRKEALEEALNRTSKTNKLQQQSVSEKKESSSQLLVASTYKGTVLIDLEKVLYFKADQKYVTVYREEDELLIDNTLKDLEQDYSEHLIRVHRSALVAKHKIIGLTKDHSGHLVVDLDTVNTGQERISVQVSRRHAQEVKDWFKSL